MPSLRGGGILPCMVGALGDGCSISQASWPALKIFRWSMGHKHGGLGWGPCQENRASSRAAGGDIRRQPLHCMDGRRGGVMRSLLDTTANLCTGQYAGVLLFARLWRPSELSCCACAAAGGRTPAGEDI